MATDSSGVSKTDDGNSVQLITVNLEIYLTIKVMEFILHVNSAFTNTEFIILGTNSMDNASNFHPQQS